MPNKKELMAAIGKTFTQMRETKNLKREYVAEQCAKKYSAVAKFEQGKADAGMAQVIMYLATMGIDIGEFVAIFEKNLAPPPTSSPPFSTGGEGCLCEINKIKRRQRSYSHQCYQ